MNASINCYILENKKTKSQRIAQSNIILKFQFKTCAQICLLFVEFIQAV